MLQPAPFPASRPRRLRQAAWMRALVAEKVLTPADLIWPCFVIDGKDRAEPIATMPGADRLTIDRLVAKAEEAATLGIPAIAIFPYTDAALKTPGAEEAWNPENLVCRATRAVKAAVPQIGVMLDVALDPYNSDGHDGIVRGSEIVNDETLLALEKQALAQAEVDEVAVARLEKPQVAEGALVLWKQVCPNNHCIDAPADTPRKSNRRSRPSTMNPPT